MTETAIADQVNRGTQRFARVPPNWQTLSLRRLFRIIGGATPKSDISEYWDGDVQWVTPADLGKIPSLEVHNSARTITRDGLDSCAAELLPPGSIIVSVRAPIGAIGIAKVPMATNQGCKGLVGQSADSKFMAYQLSISQASLEAIGRGTTFTELSATDLGSFQVAVPPLDVQQTIADFLDRETTKINALIDKQEQLIATLREDRAATITHAVTKGLDSRGGISSSGDQGPPSHWAQGVPLKRLAEVQTGLTLGRSVSPETAVTIPYLRVANVQVGRVDLTEVTEVAIDRSEVARYRLRAGDVLMTEGGDIDKLGRGCLWQGEIDPCLHQNHVFAVRCSENLDARFLVYLLDTAPAREYFTLTAKKTTNLASTNSTTLGRFSFPVPPIAEQKAIVRFLDERCSKIDALIGKSTEMIETLREYRSALITNAVTGKIDVREAV